MLVAKAAVHHFMNAPIGEWFEGKYLIKHEKMTTGVMFSIPINLTKLP